MSKLTVTIPDDLHQQIRDELERQGITTAQFIEQVVTTFFEKPKGVSNMATRTLAFQVSEELFQRIKDYLARYEQVHHRRLSQKEFVISLIEAELDEADEEFEAAEAAKAAETAEAEQAGEETDADEPWDEDAADDGDASDETATVEGNEAPQDEEESASDSDTPDQLEEDADADTDSNEPDDTEDDTETEVDTY